MADDEEELSFEQMLARVAGPEGLAALLPKGVDGRPQKQSISDAIEWLVQPEAVALVLRDIDENNDHHVTRTELAKFYRELSATLKNEDSIDALGKTQEGRPLMPEIQALLDSIRTIPEESVYKKRLEAAQTDEEKKAVVLQYLEAIKPKIMVQGLIATATALLEERVAISQTIAALPQVLDRMVEDMSPEDAASLRTAYGHIGQYSFERLGEHIDVPKLEEVFPGAAPAVPNTPSSKTR